MKLRFWRDEWNRWDGSAYHVVSNSELQADLTATAKEEMDRANLIDQKRASEKKPTPMVRKVTGRMIGDVTRALASITILPFETETPSWIGEDEPFSAAEALACRNGLVHLPSFASGKPYFKQPTPRFFSPNSLSFDFNANLAQPSSWIDFLNEVWPNDPSSISAIQEWMGYLLTPDTRQQKILMMVGPKRSGKGTISRVIKGLVGEKNVADPSLSSFGKDFGLQSLIGKTVAMINDLRLSNRSDIAAITERLLSISGEDGQDVDRKFLPTVNAVLPVRFMLSTNELPKLNDSSGALAGRIILLRMTQSWYGKEDVTLKDKLLAELPSILLWAIEGWKRLRDRGCFVQPDTGKEMIDDLADLASPVGQFVKDRCFVGPGRQVERPALFDAWNRWCEEQGQECGDVGLFGRNLKAVISTLGDGQTTNGFNKRVRVYKGVCLK
jgi:putative DNA primase/helicase